MAAEVATHLTRFFPQLEGRRIVFAERAVAYDEAFGDEREFGRKARENLGGTDHGTASSMLVMGGGVAGGRVYGQWPGLAPDKLFQGEDLEPTTDYRAVLGEILVGRLGVSPTALAEIFPGGYAAPQNWRSFLR